MALLYEFRSKCYKRHHQYDPRAAIQGITQGTTQGVRFEWLCCVDSDMCHKGHHQYDPGAAIQGPPRGPKISKLGQEKGIEVIKRLQWAVYSRKQHLRNKQPKLCNCPCRAEAEPSRANQNQAGPARAKNDCVAFW